MNKIKIFVTYKDRHKILKSDIITPIQTGRAIATEIFDEMIGDDTGDNISKQNNFYCEASAMYWAWKHYEEIGNPEYIGFMHYRRQFLFETSKLQLNSRWLASSFYNFLEFTPELSASFSDENILKFLKNNNYDYIVPAMHDVFFTGCRTVREEYVNLVPGARYEVFDKFIEICKRLLPDYKEDIERLEFGHEAQICCLFIMKKELFFEFCEMTFKVLAQLLKEINTEGMSSSALRFVGYMAEKTVTLYIMHLQRLNQHKGKYLNCSYIINPDSENISHTKWRKRLYKVLYKLSKNKKFYKKYIFYKDILRFYKANRKTAQNRAK